MELTYNCLGYHNYIVISSDNHTRGTSYIFDSASELISSVTKIAVQMALLELFLEEYVRVSDNKFLIHQSFKRYAEEDMPKRIGGFDSIVRKVFSRNIEEVASACELTDAAKGILYLSCISIDGVGMDLNRVNISCTIAEANRIIRDIRLYNMEELYGFNEFCMDLLQRGSIKIRLRRNNIPVYIMPEGKNVFG